MNTKLPFSRAGLMAIIGILIVVLGCKGRESYHYSPTDPWNPIDGSGNVVQQPRSASGISGVRLEGLGNVEVVLGGNEGLIIEADDNLLQYLRSDMIGGELVISKDPNVSLRPSRPIVYHVTASRIDSLDLLGAGNIRSYGLTGDRLELRSTGVGNFELYDMNVQELVASVTGVGDIRASGTTISQHVTLTGVTEYSARDLESVEANVQVRSNGSATVNVSDRLIVTVTGSGCVYYIGNPKIESHMIGSGCLRKIG